MSLSISALIVLLLLIATTTLTAQPINIGSRLELFVDDYLIEKMDGVDLALGHPVVRETSIMLDKPWEGITSAYVTVLKADDGFRMYYRGSGADRQASEVTCVALSKDGINWTRPNLGIYEFNGSKENNITWMGVGAHALTPFVDINPQCKPEEKFKAVGPGDGGGRSVLFAFVSPDGYRWKKLQEGPIITKGAFDSQNLVFWDIDRKEYVSYFRDFRDGVRDIKRATSKDFINWSEPEWLNITGSLKQQLYTNTVTQYYRSPGFYLGFPKRFVPDRKFNPKHSDMGISDGVFMSSRNGLDFYLWNEAFVRPGHVPENWTDRNIMAAWGMLELQPGEISLYYSNHYRHPSNRIVRATIRTDGFASLHAGGNTGTVVTKPLVFSGKELVINYATSAAGGVRVEIQQEDGMPVEGFRLDQCPVIYGDEIERVVKWNGGSDISSLSAKPVRLRFEINDGDIYSFMFR